jgi:hypothetical protein
VGWRSDLTSLGALLFKDMTHPRRLDGMFVKKKKNAQTITREKP